MKLCSKCKVKKNLGSFNKSSASKDGFHLWCRSCQSINNKERLALKRDEINAQKKIYYQNNKAKCYATTQAWANANRDKTRASVSKWEKENRHKKIITERKYRERHRAELNARRDAYRRNNLAKDVTKVTMRKYRKLQATPKWANEFFIEEIYDLARRRTKVTGFKWHVDHIVPIKHPLVCGLHVEHNLRVIPAAINLQKNNRFAP